MSTQAASSPCLCAESHWVCKTTATCSPITRSSNTHLTYSVLMWAHSAQGCQTTACMSQAQLALPAAGVQKHVTYPCFGPSTGCPAGHQAAIIAACRSWSSPILRAPPRTSTTWPTPSCCGKRSQGTCGRPWTTSLQVSVRLWLKAAADRDCPVLHEAASIGWALRCAGSW